jgi:hypothetical protein
MMSSRGALLALAAWLGMLGAASAFGGAVAPLGTPALRRAPLCASRAAARSPRAAALAVRMQEDPIPSPLRRGLVALAPIAAVALFVEYVAAPLMLDKLKAEKAEKAAKEAQK